MNEYFTSDLHFGHELVAQDRGFDTAEEHDKAVLNGLRDVLGEGDRLYILGDISGGRHESYALDLLTDLFGERSVKMHLVLGNHDSAHPMHSVSTRPEVRLPYSLPFFSMDSMGTIKHRKKKIMMSHFPYHGDRGITRYPEYRIQDCGVPILHGHTHSTEKTSYSDKGTLQINVALDAWGMKPALKSQLTDLIDESEADRLDI